MAETLGEQPEEPEEKESRWKKTGAGGWNWLKSKQGNKALLATIASAVVGGLAVAGIVVPLQDVERRVGVVESRFDGMLDRLDAVDSALSAIQSTDPVGAVASLAPQVKDLAGQVGLIRGGLGTSATATAAATPGPAVALTTTATTTPADQTVAARLTAAEAKMTQLASSLAAEQETSRTLSAAVTAIRSDLAAARTDVAAAQAAAANAQAGVVALTTRVSELESQVATLAAKQRTLNFGESGVAGPTNGAFATLSTVTVGRGRAFARWEWFHSPANANCVAQVRIVDAADTPVSATLIGDGHPNAGIYSLHATWDAGAGGAFRLQTAVSGNVICTSNRVFAEVEATG